MTQADAESIAPAVRDARRPVGADLRRASCDAALDAWAADRSRTIGEVLEEQGTLDPATREAIES